MLNQLRRHVRNIRIFRAYSFAELARQAVLFPIDYFLKGGRSSYPLNIALFVTTRCNARCSMCNLKDILNEKGKKEPTLEDIDKFLSGIKGVKPSIILFGGEPFVRKDITSIAGLVKRRGFRCGIFTNGVLLNKEIIKDLVDIDLDYLVFSLEGIGPNHDRIVGIKGAYDKLIGNMELLIKQRQKTKVIMHVMIAGENTGDLAGLARVGKSKGVDLIRFGHPTFFTSSDIERNKDVTKRLFPGEEIAEMSCVYDPGANGERFYEAVRMLKREFGTGVTFVPDLGFNEIKDWYSNDFKTKRRCLFLWRGLFVYPDGDVYPCESLRYKIGNIYEEDFQKIWNNARYRNLRSTIKSSLLPACARCCKL